ncbi:hypothetical protein S40288_09502 [Stachybotrys chartarum IBT 40288]|nr:hypothetical protein S40288_09502 [Stachybotrys chartarum IBT 40288]
MEEKNASLSSTPGPETCSSSSESHAPERSEPISSGSGQWATRNEQAPYALRNHASLAIMHENDKRELQRLVTIISRIRSGLESGAEERGEREDASRRPTDPALDPTSGSFDLYKYLEHIVGLLRREGITLAQVGVAFRDLTVSGTGDALELQHTVADWIQAPTRLGEYFSFRKKEHKIILHSFDGIVKSGELLIVLGRPGSGCSTLLKTMTGQLHGLTMDKKAVVHYNGIPQHQMMKEFKGEAIYNQEVDKHFPHLTVGQTLEFAAACRTPSRRVQGISRKQHIKHVTRVVMAICGLSHTYNTKVGNDFIRGVSGGERKRVSISETMLAGAPIAAWDNTIYQASQAIYDLFDRAVVLYEGREIFFGPATTAKNYFERMGWECPPRQTTGDFLTSVTNSAERKARSGMEDKVPRKPEEFQVYWRKSAEYQALRSEIEIHQQEFPLDSHGQTAARLQEKKTERQARHMRPKSPFTISVAMQIKLNTKRAYQRIWGDFAATSTQAVIHIVLALILGSAFYNTPNTTDGFFAKGSVLFMAILLSALTAIAEINGLYAQRPIVEKHFSYAFYYPVTEAVAGIVSDIPIKLLTTSLFSIILYFMSGLHRTPGQFFFFFLITYISTFIMSSIFRTVAAMTKTISQAMAIAGLIVLALVIYTGFVIRVPQMHPWFSWIRWIDPIYYTFEILIANEFHGRRFLCDSIVPPYQPPVGNSWICTTVGSVAGESTLSGDAFIETYYEYYWSHVWRNFGILIGFLIFSIALYSVAVEFNSSTGSAAEVLVFPRGRVPNHLQNGGGARQPVTEDMTKIVGGGGGSPGHGTQKEEDKVKAMETQMDIFTWRDVVYDVPVKGGTRRLLNNVSGWVKPGTLTALMGVSGAGKTTLLDALAQRTTTGVLTGDMFINGKLLDASFQRKTGYVQQQDLHLSTATVRESLRFSAMLRQPMTINKEEKYKFVEQVIDMLGMRDFADAVVGVTGEGLNVEQRKLLTIGVELAAKPKLVLFLDEPTSGLDSQSSWAICTFLRKLADAGQAVLCTVHQPSAVLFQQFDQLLFLAAGGKTVYFGNVGNNSSTLLDYFESNGARKCGDQENPAEYMLEVVNRGTNPQGQDWHTVWNNSKERGEVMQELERIHSEKSASESPRRDDEEAGARSEFAMPFMSQLAVVTHRVFQQYWRMPSYVFAKFIPGALSGLFIGFSFFNADATLAGMQNVIFGVFMVITIFSILVQQIQPHFVTQRALYEVRERPSKAYSWKAFILANIVVEIPYQIFTAILIYGSFYYAIIGIQSSVRQGLVLLFCIQLLLYASSFAHMTIAAFPDAETASCVVTLLAFMSLTFCGVLQTADALPGFWIFMYHVSPFTYWVSGIVATQLHGRPVDCSQDETSIFNPPQGQTCGQYLQPFLAQAPGILQNADATSDCQYCPLQVADQYLAGSRIYWSERWRNFGIMWAYIVFNIFIAVLTYWLFRVKPWDLPGRRMKPKPSKTRGMRGKGDCHEEMRN